MIALLLEDVPYEQDIRELCMAFYPGREYLHSVDDKPNDNPELVIRASREKGIYILTIGHNYDEVLYRLEIPATGVRFDEKCDIKKALYETLSKETGKHLPWGTLTGIRPTKIVMARLDEGMSISDASDYLRQTYLTSDEKTKLCVDTAVREKKLIDKIDYEQGWSLYVGIPFCPTRCLYCSFTSYPIDKWQDATAKYIEALCTEIGAVCEMMKDRNLQTIYMGGGTPTALSAENLDSLLTYIDNTCDMSHLIEYTVESGRPDSITADKIEVLKKHHVERISINPQTMKQKTLDIIGRQHTVDMVIEKYNMARDMGIDNINMDLIVGLPEETIADVEHTMREIEKLKPDSVTVHSLAIKRAARLNTQKEDYADLKCESTWEMIELTQKYCHQMGLNPYYLYRQKNMAGNFENVGYATEGKECLYNILIMEEKQTIVACGAGATSRIRHIEDEEVDRIENVKDPGIYIERIDEMIARKQKMLAKS